MIAALAAAAMVVLQALYLERDGGMTLGPAWDIGEGERGWALCEQAAHVKSITDPNPPTGQGFVLTVYICKQEWRA